MSVWVVGFEHGHTIQELLLNPAGSLPPPSIRTPFTVVIVNHNEPYLVATVQSVLSIEDQQFIRQVLIVDDQSVPQVEYSWFPSDARIQIYRSPLRLGLIRARGIGGDLAQGPFMVFIDAHCKPHPNWLEPIGKLLIQSPKRIVNMEVGLLNGTSWSEIPSPGGRMAKATFQWNLGLAWEKELTRDQIVGLSGTQVDANPDLSPMTMGMFATTKQWWTLIGGLDRGLNTWGGENIEISLRTWLCGGDIVVARGAVVDHTFRTKFPYEVRGDVYRRNIVRVVEAWFDTPSKRRFYAALKLRPGAVHPGDLEDTHAMQRRLNCRTFEWFLTKFKGRAPLDK
jgi:polypeptide N-acetylgalactosaminyltransferase